jgi:hypothetical protein
MRALLMRSGLLIALALAGPALAWPVDVVVDLEAGSERFQKLSAIGWAQAEDPKVATAEVLESGELLLSGVSPGRTLVLLYAEGKFAVWRLRVAAKGGKVKAVEGTEALAAAKKACPGLVANPGAEEAALVGTIKDEKCRQALLALFQTDAYLARELELTFDLQALQAQLIALQAAFKAAGLPKLDARYHGAGLVLDGHVTEAQHRTALWEVFRRSAARAPLEDRLDVEEPDAGLKPREVSP